MENEEDCYQIPHRIEDEEDENRFECWYIPAYDFSSDEDEDNEPEFDCGFIPEEGMCMKAGSEECDFECPYSEFEVEGEDETPVQTMQEE